MWPLYGSGDIKDMQRPRELQGLGDRLVLFELEGRPAPATLFELFALICFLPPYSLLASGAGIFLAWDLPLWPVLSPGRQPHFTYGPFALTRITRSQG